MALLSITTPNLLQGVMHDIVYDKTFFPIAKKNHGDPISTHSKNGWHLNQIDVKINAFIQGALEE